MKKVITLTTIPPRFRHLRKTLESLDRQNVDVVYLNLPNYCDKTQTSYEIPEWFKEIEWQKLKINHCDSDYGPATKLIPTLELERAPDTQILVCDDDFWYEDSWSDAYFDQFLDGHFVCGNGSNTIFVEQDLMQEYQLTTIFIESLSGLLQKKHFDFPEVFSGLLFERSSLDVERFKHLTKLNQACFYADDLVIAKFFSENKVAMKRIGLDKLKMHSLDHYGLYEWSLAAGNTGGNRHNYMQAFPQLAGVAEQVDRLLEYAQASSR